MQRHYAGNFGFTPNVKITAWQNIKMVISKMTLTEYHSHNANMKCHDSCIHTPPPSNMAKLLGLGNKFCMQSKSVNEKQFYLMLERFRYDARVKNYVLFFLMIIKNIYIVNHINFYCFTSMNVEDSQTSIPCT